MRKVQFTDLLNYCKAYPDLTYLVYNKLGEASGISYSNSDEVTARVVGSEIFIGFSLPKEARVDVGVLDLNGVEINSVIKGRFDSGQYNYTALMDKPGIYLVRVEINGNINMKKVIVK